MLATLNKPVRRSLANGEVLRSAATCILRALEQRRGYGGGSEDDRTHLYTHSSGAHNAIRGAYGLGRLSADGNLDAWVNQAIYQYNSGSRDCGNNGHDGSAAANGMGENFWLGMGQDSVYQNGVSMAAAVDSWNQEAGNYFAWSGRRSNPNERLGLRHVHRPGGQPLYQIFPYGVVIGCRYQAIGNMFGSSGGQAGVASEKRRTHISNNNGYGVVDCPAMLDADPADTADTEDALH
ncbi:hypothetical protein DFJ73DRAFT_803600 [Zopfochytrium polystomum]|nr:hypothetical protein DFJ73DRAFT_803600 [Zopfochytrium polystomum]